MLQRIAVLFLISSLLAAAAFAQDARNNELGLLLGGAVTPAIGLAGGGRAEVGSGLTYQATYARRLINAGPAALYLELPFLATPLQDISSGNGAVPANYDSLFVTPGLRVKLLPRAALSPWFSVGGGYALFETSAQRVDGAPNLNERVTHRGAAQFGGGLDVRLPIQILVPISFRLEVRDLYSGKPNYNVNTGGGFQHNLVFSGGVVVHL